MKIRRFLPLLLILASLAFVACGDDGEETTTATETRTEETTGEPGGVAPPTEGTDERAASGEAVRSARVEIEGFAYVPETVTVKAGGKVTWINRDAEEHTATLDDDSFDTGDLAEGKLKSQSFKEAGTYSYFCEIHPEMTGTVEVVD